jgi:Spt5 transcription elongation factor, acidic N-terminal
MSTSKRTNLLSNPFLDLEAVVDDEDELLEADSESDDGTSSPKVDVAVCDLCIAGFIINDNDDSSLRDHTSGTRTPNWENPTRLREIAQDIRRRHVYHRGDTSEFERESIIQVPPTMEDAGIWRVRIKVGFPDIVISQC